jgi:hypothetical protein
MLVLVMSLTVLYGCVCGLVAEDADAPRWLRWPGTAWKTIAHDWRRPAPMPPRPDYARIAVLERELGLVDSHLPELSPFEQGMRSAMAERPIRLSRTVCLTKDCAGDTREIRTWSGLLAARVHTCEAP